MGLTHTKLHHKVLQENWRGICRRLREDEDAKEWVKTQNPCGDTPLHLACYRGHAPPIVIRTLLAAYPEAIHVPNKMGFKPIELAKQNYYTGHPYREEVLEYLEAYAEGRSIEISDTSEEDETETAVPTAAAALPRLVSQPYVTSKTCVVCMERPADHVIIPCGHVCLSGNCAQKVLDGKVGSEANSKKKNQQRFCPVCRCVIEAIVKVNVVVPEQQQEQLQQQNLGSPTIVSVA